MSKTILLFKHLKKFSFFSIIDLLIFELKRAGSKMAT